MDKENQKPKVNYRIGIPGMVSIGALGVILDLISLVPAVGDAAGPIFGIIAGAYSYKVGVKIFSGKKLAVLLTAVIIKMIPILQEIPIELTVGWIAVVIMTRTEDKLGISLNPTKKIGINPARNQRLPVNSQAGIRPPNRQ